MEKNALLLGLGIHLFFSLLSFSFFKAMGSVRKQVLCLQGNPRGLSGFSPDQLKGRYHLALCTMLSSGRTLQVCSYSAVQERTTERKHSTHQRQNHHCALKE